MKLIKRYQPGGSVKIDWSTYNPNFIHDIIKDQYLDELREMENPTDKGKDIYADLYRIYKGPQENPEIGWGLDLNKNPKYLKEAQKGMTGKRLHEIYDKEILGDALLKIENKIKECGGSPSFVPQKWYKGLLDMYFQLGWAGLNQYNNMFDAIANLNLEGLQNESMTTWKDSKGKRHEDVRRHNLRIDKWFNNKY